MARRGIFSPRLTLHRKSLDVRAKQRLSFHVVFLTRSCAYSVSPHVNSIVRRFVFGKTAVRDVMKKLFQNTPFIIGFWSMIIIFLVLNIIPSETNKFSNIIIDRGFPFLMYREGISSNYSTYVFWSGLIADIVIALVCSLAAGLSFKLIWSKITSRHLS